MNDVARLDDMCPCVDLNMDCSFCKNRWIEIKRDQISNWPNKICEKLFKDALRHMHSGCYCNFLWKDISLENDIDDEDEYE